ncbi:MAG: YdbL family protein [Cycloclasticus sp.]
MKYLLSLCAALLISVSTTSFALDLQSAKGKGLVGETPSGYLADPAGTASAEVKALMQDINAKRKVKYAEIAAKVGKPLGVVEQLAGKKAIEKTETGRLVQLPDGSWVKK